MLLPLLLSAALSAPPEVYLLHPAADAAVLAGAAAVLAVPELLGSGLVSERCADTPCDRSEVFAFERGVIGNSSGRASGASDVTLALALAAPPLADVLLLGNGPALRQDLVVYGETLAVAAALAQVAKYTVQRPLPRTYGGDPDYTRRRKGYLSFYSGHTTLTFAALSAASMTARYRYGEQVWPWLVTAAVGASVGVERVAAGRHFPTDVVAGALTGVGVGILVPMLHRRPRDGGIAVSPAARGFALSFRF